MVGSVTSGATSSVSLAAIVFLAGASLAGTRDDSAESPEWRPDQVIVKFHDGVDANTSHDVIGKHQCVCLQVCELGRSHLLAIPDSRMPEDVVADFLEDESVEYAEVNYRVRLFFEPNDPYFSYQWNLHDADAGGIDMEAAWGIEMGDPNVIVAVLDTGVAFEDYGVYRRAPDLAQTRFVMGYDFVNNDDHPNDDNGHGTHIAGTLAQSTNNALGVAGIAFGCSIMPVKVMDAAGEGDYFAVSQGIYFAVRNGANVINISLGASSASTTLRNAVAHAYQNGVTVVCAAGNEYEDGNAPNYPAAYNSYCIAVGATRYDQRRAYYSNTGSYLDVVAPGGDMRIDQNQDGYPDGIVQQTFALDPADFAYYYLQGTSMAAPHVSGLAALLISHGVIEPDNVRKALQQTAVDLGPAGWDGQYGWGLIDAPTALQYFGAAGD
jgi:serine protease